MLRFACDYQEGAIPEIIERLTATNLESTPGYGKDDYCEEARRLIREACAAPDAAVHFFVGGTQTNSIVIHALLEEYQGVISPASGHITGHEAGAVESKGHKVLVVPQKDGKISGESVCACMRAYLADDSREHAVEPGLVYISHPTEHGTLYTKAELESIREACDEYGLPLFLDGARLGYGLAAEGTDVTLADIAALTDVFYIGGTKCGALFGEAVVIRDPKRLPRFFTTMKQNGAVLAKGRLLGLQFATLMENGTYERVCAHGVRLAQKLKLALIETGHTLFIDTPTNQIFVYLSAEEEKTLSKDFSFAVWHRDANGRALCRFVTSGATTEEAIDTLIAALKKGC